MAQEPTTTIAGIQYSTKLLGGRDARAVGLVVTSAVLRGISVALGKADLSKIIKAFTAPAEAPEGATAETSERRLSRMLESLSWGEIAGALGGIADGGATLLEMLGPDGLERATAAFTAQTTVYLPSPVASAGGQLFATPLANRDDHWVGRWPQYLQWLMWEVQVNGFFPDLAAMAARSRPSNGTAGAQASPPPPPEGQAST